MYNLEALYQRVGRARNSQLVFDNTVTGTQTLVSALTDTTRTIFVQRIIVVIQTDAAQSITFQDSNGTPVFVEKIPASPGVNTRWEFYFGPRGLKLTAGKNLVAVFSGAGLAGAIMWNTYQTPEPSVTAPGGAAF